MPETSIPLGGIHLKLLRLSLENLDYLKLLSLKAESLLVKIACSNDISGGYSDGVPPLPIPNREVKPDRADGTAHPRESRSPPFYESPEFNMNSGPFYVSTLAVLYALLAILLCNISVIAQRDIYPRVAVFLCCSCEITIVYGY